MSVGTVKAYLSPLFYPSGSVTLPVRETPLDKVAPEVNQWRTGWEAGKLYGKYAGAVGMVASMARAGAELGAPDPGAMLLGLVVGGAVGVVEERCLGVGRLLGSFFTGLGGAVNGYLAGLFLKPEA